MKHFEGLHFDHPKLPNARPYADSQHREHFWRNAATLLSVGVIIFVFVVGLAAFMPD